MSLFLRTVKTLLFSGLNQIILPVSNEAKEGGRVAHKKSKPTHGGCGSMRLAHRIEAVHVTLDKFRVANSKLCV